MNALLWVDLVIAFTLIEAAALGLYHRTTRQGVAPSKFVWNLASGLCLMLSVRAVLVGAGIAWIGLALLAAGACHGVDLWRRWPR